MIAIYARQSVDKKDSISIESQIEFCKKEFDETEAYKTYIDKGFSGKDTNRPAFVNMMNDVRAGQIKKVIVYKLDRISRSTLDFANIINIFKKHDVEFISSTEKFDTSTPIGKAMLNIIMTFAELERETIQKRIKDNYYARGKKGFFTGGRVPFGFNKTETKVDGKKTSMFEPNPEQISYLIKMYEMYANTNTSLGKISDYLNENNIPAPDGGRWDSNKVSRILHNPVYVRADADVYQYYKNRGCIISNDISDFIGTNGCYLYGKRDSNERKYTKVENHVLSLALHEGIIDSHTWLLCQYKLDSNKQIKNDGKGKHTWLSGIAKCGYCKYAVSVIKSSTGNYKYFNCRGKTNLKICKGHSRPILVSDVETIIEERLFEKIKQLKHITVDTQVKEDININRIKLQLIEIDKQIENLVEKIAEANDIAMKYINEKITSLDRQKSSLLEELQKLTLENSKSISMNDIFKKIDNWQNMTLEEKKQICSSLINKVYITDDEISIDWKV
jgi:DNA invertase Pin-like site-specific DNA recombinase